MIRAVLPVMMVPMVMVLAVMMSGRIVGAVLRNRRAGAAQSHGKGNRKGCADAGNELHFCLL